MESAHKKLCGESIKRLRTEANMTIAELSERMSLHNLIVDETEIERIEAGASVVSDIELFALSEIFAAPPDNLICAVN